MATDEALREHVLTLLRGNVDRRFEAAVRDFPAEFINVNPPNVDYTPWHLIEHLGLGLWDIVGYIRNPQHVSPKHPDGYWPPKGQRADGETWNRSLDQFRTLRKDLEDLLRTRRPPCWPRSRTLRGTRSCGKWAWWSGTAPITSASSESCAR